MEKAGVNDIALFLVRVTMGVIFVGHGLQKVFGLFGGPGIDGVTAMLSGMGFAYPGVWAWMVSLSEAIGGLFLVLGIMPRTSAGLIVIIMSVAIAKVHGSHGLFASNNGFEYPLLILVTAVFLISSGGGRFSFFDRL